MPITLGQKPDSGFDHPIGLLSDCHRRIERFLAAQIEVARTADAGPLDPRHREALEKSLRYFRNASPWHTADEEHSLFPRMRASNDPAVHEALAAVDRLEADHRDAEAKHEEANALIERWLEHATLPAAERQHLRELLESLQAIYAEHIPLEDKVLFPLAERTLSAHQLQAVGREMAERRGVDPGKPPRRCQHSSHHNAATEADRRKTPPTV